MPNPPSQPAPRQSNLVKVIAIVLLALIVLVGLAVLITWLIIKPKRLDYSIEDGSVNNYSLTRDHLTANFDFVLRAHNPNHRVSFYYDSMEVSVAYDDQIVAFDTVKPFYQRHKNVTRLEVKPVAKSVQLMKSVSRDLRLEKSSGSVEFSFYGRAKIRYKIGMWKSRRHTLKIKCKSVVVPFVSSKHFDRAHCHTHF